MKKQTYPERVVPTAPAIPVFSYSFLNLDSGTSSTGRPSFVEHPQMNERYITNDNVNKSGLHLQRSHVREKNKPNALVLRL